MQYGCLKLVHFSKKSGGLSSTGSEILIFGSHCSANFQPILDCFIPKFKLEYDDLENINRVNAVIFNLHQIKRLKLLQLPKMVKLPVCMVNIEKGKRYMIFHKCKTGSKLINGQNWPN